MFWGPSILLGPEPDVVLDGGLVSLRPCCRPPSRSTLADGPEKRPARPSDPLDEPLLSLRRPTGPPPVGGRRNLVPDVVIASGGTAIWWGGQTDMCLQEAIPRGPQKEAGALAYLGEAAGGPATLLLQGRPGDTTTSLRAKHRGPLSLPSCPPLPLPAHCSLSLACAHSIFPFPSLLQGSGRPPRHFPSPQEALSRVRAATHKLRGVWGLGPPALDGASVPLRGSGLQGTLLRVSSAGLRDRHGHGDRWEQGRGLRAERVLHHTEELWGKWW